MTLHLEILDSIQSISQQDWDNLTDASPLISHAFFSAFEHTQCVGAQSGWQPNPLVVKNQGKLVGAMPLYLKYHSYGEYVFDWSWAEAYQQSGFNYYPKLVCALPFTPITSPRLLGDSSNIQTMMAEVVVEQVHQHQLSSAHVLFANDADAEVLAKQGWLKRKGVQFRWQNQHYQSFEEFLNTLSHDKRKKIHQERKKIALAGVTCRRLSGTEITLADWQFFFACYQNTYLEHHSTPYLNQAFFMHIGQTMSANIVMMIAEISGKPIAATLNFYGTDKHGVSQLYGRYWGAVEFVSGLHFELCYYQAQIFCIERGIQYFEGGAQGEHKLARGFTARPTQSFHYIADPQFKAAIARFLQREALGMGAYVTELEERTPFKHG